MTPMNTWQLIVASAVVAPVAILVSLQCTTALLTNRHEQRPTPLWAWIGAAPTLPVVLVLLALGWALNSVGTRISHAARR